MSARDKLDFVELSTNWPARVDAPGWPGIVRDLDSRGHARSSGC